MPRFASVVFIIALAFAVWSIVERDSFQTDLFSILPDIADARLPTASLDAFSDKLSRRVVYLVSAGKTEDTLAMAQQIAERAAASGLFESFGYRFDHAAMQESYQALQPYRHGLLTYGDAMSLQRDEGEFLVRRFTESLVAPVAGLSSASLVSDPFQLFARYLGSFTAASQRAELLDGAVYFRERDKHYLLINAVLSGSAFDQTTQERYAGFYEELAQLTAQWPAAEVLSQGVIRHAMANRVTAQQEIGLIGGGSLLAILLLFFLVFRRPALLLYIALPVFVGLALALLVCLLLFGQIHIITLVFGASLIGVSIDYTFHYCCANSSLSPYPDARAALTAIRPALTIGLLTSAVGYLTLATTGFPGLQQMAVFAVAGLCGAYVSVLYILPAFIRSSLQVSRPFTTCAASLLRHVHASRVPSIIVLGVILLAGIALFLVFKNTSDDVRDMRARFVQLENEEQRVQAMLGEMPNSQYFVVSATRTDELLEAMTQLEEALQQQPGGRTVNLSRWLPSTARQAEHRALLHALLQRDGLVLDRLVAAGIPAKILHNYAEQLAGEASGYLTPEVFLATDFGRTYRDLWLGEQAGRRHAIVLLFGYTDLPALQRIADSLPGAVFVDRAGYVSQLFKHYRDWFERMAPFVLLAMVVLLSLRYGAVSALRIISIPLIAALLALTAIVLLQGQYNLFHLLGLIVTIAVAIDYGVFMREASAHSAHVLLAILLSALTTTISLGLLALSMTPALAAFGLSLLLGVLMSGLLTFVFIRPARQEPVK